MKRPTKIQRLVNRLGPQCWYTGLQCQTQHPNRGDSATREHLIPLKRLQNLDTAVFPQRLREKNIVVSCRKINNLVGNAPFSIKIELRKVLLSALQHRTANTPYFDRTDFHIINDVVKSFLKNYIAYNRAYVWDVNDYDVETFSNTAKQKEIKEAKQKSGSLLADLYIKECEAFYHYFREVL